MPTKVHEGKQSRFQRLIFLLLTGAFQMTRGKSLFLTLFLSMLLIVTAACSSTASTNVQTKSSTMDGNSVSASATVIPTYASSSAPRTSSTVTVIGNTDLPIQVYSMMVNGKMQNVLTNSNGMTLYYDVEDTPASVCTDRCAWDWPPLLVPNGSPTSAVSLPGKLGILMDGNGRQATYNGHPLYIFAVDSGPHQTTGEGEEGDWHVVTTALK
jgi:predicted lipoprotein with Yx(FWY)xxD motif